MFHENRMPATAATPVRSTSATLMPSAARKYSKPSPGTHAFRTTVATPSAGR